MSNKLIYKDIAPGAKEDINAIETADNYDKLADVEYIKNEQVSVQRYATIEKDFWKLDGTYNLIENTVTAFWSNNVSGDHNSDGRYYFDTPITLTRIFNNKYTSVGMSFDFDEPDYCNYLNIKWYNDDELIEDVDFEPDSSNYYCQKNVELFNKTVITLYAMSKPNRYLKIFSIDDGVNRVFEDKDIYSISILEDMSLISEDIPINTIDFSIKRTENTEFIFQHKQPLLVYHNDKLQGMFFIDSSERESKDVYNVTGQCYKGILDANTYNGGIYNCVKAGTIIEDIFKNESIRVQIDDVTYNTELTGYIPICSKREALSQVLFAACSVCDTSRIDYFKVFRLNRDAIVDIVSDRIYTGGKTSTTDIMTSVKLTIHEYVKETELKEVFNGNLEQGINKIEFSNPIDVESLSVAPGTILDKGANYCIVDVPTAGKVTAGAYEYTDQTIPRTMTNSNVVNGTATNEIIISEATLVSTSNANDVLMNVFSYYLNNESLETDFVLDRDLCGQYTKLHTEWSGDKTGFISQIEYEMGSKLIGKVVQHIG